MMKIFAQAPIPLGPIGGDKGEGLGPFAGIKYDGTIALSKVTGAVSSIIGFMTVAAAIWFIFQFLVGGFYWITSGGDKQKLHEARDRITNAFIGLIVVIIGWSILALTGQFFGYDIVVKDPGKVIQQLQIK